MRYPYSDSLVCELDPHNTPGALCLLWELDEFTLEGAESICPCFLISRYTFTYDKNGHQKPPPLAVAVTVEVINSLSVESRCLVTI